MLIRSFRVAPSRLPALFLAATILTGCGGSSAAKAPDQTVSGPGFTFTAPAGWKLTVDKRRATASHDDELVQVAAFPLLKPYSNALFTKVDRELRARMRQIAGQTGGSISSSSTVTAGGIRSHSYDVTAGGHVDQYTFVLRGMREFQLLCRRKSSSADDACRQLITSFRPLA
jgi:hypothetical protein